MGLHPGTDLLRIQGYSLFKLQISVRRQQFARGSQIQSYKLFFQIQSHNLFVLRF